MNKFLPALFLALLFSNAALYAGNKDRQGVAGADELLINPWARSSGWDGLNTACVRGIESLNLNVGGLAFTDKTELVFAHTDWLEGTGVNLNSFGFSQSLGKSGSVIGFDVTSVSFGDIQVTTNGNPDGNLGTYRPQFINIAGAYAKEFSNSIYGGIVFRGISESLSNVHALGFSIDAGIQYATGPKSDPTKIKFGIALRNIGLPMVFSGDGLAFRGPSPDGTFDMTLQQRSQNFELPSLLNIGGSYDFRMGANKEHRLTVAANFTSNSFAEDQIGAGLEYAFKEMIMIRAGYNYEQGIFDNNTRVTALTGIAAGITFEVPLKKNGPTLGIDYSYRTSNPFNGCHAIGVRLNL